jgi:2-amino-4-hydroxy-6-hydroxymethyldihydropteridine diphosphokinase
VKRVLIALGSNIEPETNVPAAIAQLAHHPDMRLLASSPTYVTPAVGADGTQSGQADFHNAAALIETSLHPAGLVDSLRTIEHQLGRVRTNDKFAPRPIDLDIALVEDSVIDVDGRHIPDPDVVRFPHIAVPLADIAADWRHPETGITLGQIAQSFNIKESEIQQL